MKAVLTWAINNAPSMNTMMIAVLTVGAAAMTMIRRERYPDHRPDEITVSVPYPGASPTETEEGVCLKVEEAIRSIVGIEKIVSRAREGSGRVTAELYNSVDDPERVLNEVRGAVDRISTFPRESERPSVRLSTRFQSVISVAILAPANSDPHNDPAAEQRLRAIAEQVYEEVLRLPEVSHVDLWQAKPYQIDVEISESTLRRHGLTHHDVAAALRAGNVELPGGEIRSPIGDLLLRAANKHVTGDEIAKLPVIGEPGGAVITVGDLGVVRDGFADIDIFARTDDRPSMSIKIRMTGAEDMLTIREQVVDYVANKQMPLGYDLKTWDDYSGHARDRLDLLMRNGVMGLILVFLVLGVFLDLRLAFWVALGIPISVCGTCAVMLAVGASLNIHSMFAFVMALGIVVDDAIVISENVYSHRLRGKTGVRAAIDGAAEVAPAVISSVVTTVIAFIPLAFVTGEMGKWIAVMPLGLVAMLLISLVESMLILPCHLAHSRLPDNPQSTPRFQRFIQRLVDQFIDRVYTPAFRWSLERPAVVFSGSFAALLISLGLYHGGFTPFVFNQQLDWEFLYTYIEYPNGTPTKTIDEATQQLERAFREVEREEFPTAKETLTTTFYRGVGYTNQLNNKRGEVYAEFKRGPFFREKSSRDLIAKWRAKAGDFPGAERVVFWGINHSPGGRPIELSLLSSDVDQLDVVAEKFKRRLATYQGVVDIHDSRGPGKWELRIKLKTGAHDLGVRLDQLGRIVRGAFHGEEVMRLQRGRHEVKLMVRYPPDERRSLYQLNEIRVPTRTGGEIPLEVLADISVARGFSSVHRIDQQRAVTITANVDDQIANAPDIIRDLRDGDLADLLAQHPQVRARWEGQQEETRRSFNSLMLGFMVAIFGMYAVLTLQFRSLVQPLIVLAVLPFGFVGAVGGHWLLGQSLTLFSLFGVVTLSGIVANDSIVLIDFINRRLAEGVPLPDALRESGRRRFRPVMLTSITTVAALLPMLLERTTQAQILIPMAISVSFGLIVATLWILFLVPAIYSVYARFRPANEGAASD
ncbi:MAG: efflux RND transporter permease subunit [Pirellulaceae bacterium]|jgi:multidrug efflux pump subunit AcrB|nr:efflux RND transporter permease subunit [Pirellulaceae bacterium]MDP7019140.1 efflux RND transporter permease subunit [Pirellulaceae bacterium]